MNIPLYRNAAGTAPWSERVRGPMANRGLVFDKYFDGWNDSHDGLGSKETSKRDGLSRVAGAIDTNPGTAAALAAKRQRDLVVALGGCCWQVEATSRFVTGTGIANPIENGFAWHYTLGVPYLPGSGLKGALRAYLEEWTDRATDANRLLGDQGAGDAILFDMLPTANLKLATDVMTPHYSDWYAEAANAPGDWMPPNPIPFLVVETGARFQVAIAPRHRRTVTPADLQALRQQLIELTELIGLGAKTAVGYGRFKLVV